MAVEVIPGESVAVRVAIAALELAAQPRLRLPQLYVFLRGANVLGLLEANLRALDLDEAGALPAIPHGRLPPTIWHGASAATWGHLVRLFISSNKGGVLCRMWQLRRTKGYIRCRSLDTGFQRLHAPMR